MTRRRRVAVVGGVAIILAVIAGGTILAMPAPAPAYTPSAANTDLHAALLEAGVTDAVVDVTPDRVLIRYAVPEGMHVEKSIIVVAVVAASHVDRTESLVIQALDGETPVQQVIVPVETVRAFESNDIDREALWAAMDVRPAG